VEVDVGVRVLCAGGEVQALRAVEGLRCIVQDGEFVVWLCAPEGGPVLMSVSMEPHLDSVSDEDSHCPVVPNARLHIVQIRDLEVGAALRALQVRQ
jgi:hypothetical protein